MMRAAIALGAVLAASCQEGRRVDILLGPDEATLSQGFQCNDGSGLPLARRAYDMPNLRFSVNLVVDFIDLGGGVPGCRGEEIGAWCQDHECRPIVVAARYCAPVVVENISLSAVGGLAARVAEIYDQLRSHGPVIADGPDQPVIVRAVATTQPCADLVTPTGGAYPPFLTDSDDLALVGCAYSCPVQLDQVTTAVQLSFDSINPDCEPGVQACAGALAPP